MNYAALIIETEAELTELETRQKLVHFQQRIRFLRLLKTGEAKMPQEASEMVGWMLRQWQKIWQLYRVGGVGETLRFVFNLFVTERSRELSEKTLLIVDGAGAQRLEGDNRQIELSQLPPYSGGIKFGRAVVSRVAARTQVSRFRDVRRSGKLC
jgi:hypothetical protein